MSKRKTKSAAKKPNILITAQHLEVLEDVMASYHARLEKLHWDLVCLTPVADCLAGLKNIRELEARARALKSVVYDAFCAQFEAEQARVGYVLKKIEDK